MLTSPCASTAVNCSLLSVVWAHAPPPCSNISPACSTPPHPAVLPAPAGCVSMSSVKLQCPGLGDSTTKIPPLKEEPKHVKPSHPPIARMLKDNLLGSAATTAEAKDAAWASSGGESIIPHVHRPF